MTTDGDRPDSRPSADPSRWSRRQFCAYGAAAATALTGASAWSARQTMPAARRKVMHIIGHSHIDLTWLWPWRDGADVVLNTFRSALDRMNETPDFRFIHSSSVHYRWVERADPRMFEEVRRRIAEGRWEVVGGWPVEPDCNLPSAESFMRHSLYGKAYFRETLGIDVDIGFNPDAFGHAAGLPTLLSAAGFKYYAFMRPQETEASLPQLFWWEGPDGARLLTLRIHRSYSNPADRLADAADKSFADGFDDAAFFLGVGDHGGGVTRAQIKEVLRLREDPSLPELRWSTLGEFFRQVEASPAMADLPVIRGELQHHARGCYSAHGGVKYDNRRAERALACAEAASLVARTGIALDQPVAPIREAWNKVLFNQFHDILAGTSLAETYQDTRDGIGWACETAATTKIEALQAMARRVDTRQVAENALFLFNPLPWKRKAFVDVYIKRVPRAQPQITHLRAADGSAVPVQLRPSRSMTNSYPRLAAWVELPACGYRVFEIAKDGKGADHVGHAPSASDDLFSFRADDGTELLSAPLGLVVIKDGSSTWGHKMDHFREELGRPTFASSETVEEGPVVRVTRHRALWQDSQILLDISRFTGTDAVELRFVIDWREREQILKLEVPTRFPDPAVFAKVAGAIARRTANGDEEPCQDWVALQDTIDSRPYTLGLVNNSSYSHDCLGGLLRTILVRSAPFARHSAGTVAPETIHDANAWLDQGRQERTFWLVGGQGTHATLELDRRCEELQTPAEHVTDSAHAGDAPWERSFLEVSPTTFAVLAVKRAEDGDGAVVRIQERTGSASTCRLTSGPLGVDQTLPFRPFEIKTIHIATRPTDGPALREVCALEADSHRN